MTAADCPGVSLVIPVYNEAEDLRDVLTSIEAQLYSHAALFLILVDGGSSDGSLEIARDWLARTDIAGEIVPNPRRTIPTSLNAGIARVRSGDIVVRLDGHTTYAPDYVARIVEAFALAPSSVGCVGGPQVPAIEFRFDRALVAALYTNPMGLGGAAFRGARAWRPVRSVYLGAWRPGVLEAVGGYDERWQANEDAELAARLRKCGYRTLLIPVESWYRVKRGPLAAIRQWWRYGYWRAQTLRRHPDELAVRHLAPPLALFACLVLLATPLWPLCGIIVTAYLAALVAKRPRLQPLEVTLASCIFFPVCQISWTLGLLEGLTLNRSLAPSTPPASAGDARSRRRSGATDRHQSSVA